jgi:hypothetical protein
VSWRRPDGHYVVLLTERRDLRVWTRWIGWRTVGYGVRPAQARAYAHRMGCM